MVIAKKQRQLHSGFLGHLICTDEPGWVEKRQKLILAERRALA